jgi:hypothetical protein
MFSIGRSRHDGGRDDWYKYANLPGTGNVRSCREEVRLVRCSRSAAVSLPGQVVSEKGELPIVLDAGQRQV